MGIFSRGSSLSAIYFSLVDTFIVMMLSKPVAAKVSRKSVTKKMAQKMINVYNNVLDEHTDIILVIPRHVFFSNRNLSSLEKEVD